MNLAVGDPSYEAFQLFARRGRFHFLDGFGFDRVGVSPFSENNKSQEFSSIGYDDFHSMVAIDSSCLISSLMSELVRRVAGSSVILAGCLVTGRLLA